jgi:SAM-dependent methyltransferase
MSVPSDSSRPEFWDCRFAGDKTPWDCHGIPEKLKAYLSQTKPGRVLIPGCGSAYEVAAFYAAGWSVMAIDFSPVAVARAKSLLGLIGEFVVLGDFFKHPLDEFIFDVIYERTFLCALPPKLWEDYAVRMRQLIRPGGKLIGFFLYGDEPEPPPYPLTKVQAGELFGRDFTLTHDDPVTNSLPVFVGMERWQERTRLH